MRVPNLALAVFFLLPSGVLRVAAQSELFDGAKGRRGDVAAQKDAPSSGRKAAADPDGLDEKQRDLLDGLLARVDLKPGDDPRAPALLHQTFVKIVRTPTGAEMSERFIAANARAVVDFSNPGNSDVTIVNGKAVLLWSGGDTDVAKRPPVVRLNRGYLNSDSAWRGPEMAGTIGHELFGHALESQRADGVTDALNYYRGDEANAGLLGWLIEIEAGAPTNDGRMWNYLQDPEKFHKALEMHMAYYAGTFSVEEMKDPLAALKGRRARLDEARARLHEDNKNTDSWRPIIEHFVAVHGVRSENFKSARESIDGFDAYATAQDKEYATIAAHIDELSTRLLASDCKELETLWRAAESPYYIEAEQRLRTLRERLGKTVANRAPEPTTPPVPGQIDLDQLSVLYNQDLQDHPEHWPK